MTNTAETFRDGPTVAAPPVQRGRHRRPRSRRPLYAAGGLALAAGLLGLLRVVPESGTSAPGTAEAEAEPRPDPGDGPTRSAAHTPVAAESVPTARPSATVVMGGVAPAPAPGPGRAPAPRATAPVPHPAPLPGATTGVAGPPRTHTRTPTTPAPAHSAPGSTTTPGSAPGSTHTPAKPPSQGTPDPEPTYPELCVPVIGLCVNGSERGL
ncbi:hypothetical protein [Streptomyces sp. NPDC086787]|uniref:hypothetical protein n=1 Tax=Streptomyces sp. NPDC086787 TaxID=3365759 RepID=UPI0037F9AE86